MKLKKNYYKVLDIKTNARSDEIKKAYRKLVKQFHPDYNPGSDVSQEMLKKINEAYEVLSDTTKRTEYDLFLGINQKPHHIQKENVQKQYRQEKVQSHIDIADIFKRYSEKNGWQNFTSISRTRKLQKSIYNRIVSACIGLMYIISAYIVLMDVRLIAIVFVYVTLSISCIWYSEEVADFWHFNSGILIWLMGWLCLVLPYLFISIIKHQIHL